MTNMPASVGSRQVTEEKSVRSGLNTEGEVMDWVVALGTVSLGVVIGTLVGFYVGEAKELTRRVVTSAISIFAGAGVLAIFQFLGAYSSAGHEVWFYPIGLAIGFGLGLRYSY
jgi:ABC-type transport system involved in multi-copper enzyme maturation permease subunit